LIDFMMVASFVMSRDPAAALVEEDPTPPTIR
jgi:hypothetical protein